MTQRHKNRSAKGERKSLPITQMRRWPNQLRARMLNSSVTGD
jgi:hypothetical protein